MAGHFSWTKQISCNIAIYYCVLYYCVHVISSAVEHPTSREKLSGTFRYDSAEVEHGFYNH